MQNERSRFLEMLKEEEHLYLFSAGSVVRFFADLGCPHVSFEPAFFSHYDMFITVSREALAPIDTAVQEERLVQGKRAGSFWRSSICRTSSRSRQHDSSKLTTIEPSVWPRTSACIGPGGVGGRPRKASGRHRTSPGTARIESDRERHLADIGHLQGLLAESESDRAARLESINTLGASLANVEADRVALREANDSLTSQLLKLQADHAQGLGTVESLTANNQPNED